VRGKFYPDWNDHLDKKNENKILRGFYRFNNFSILVLHKELLIKGLLDEKTLIFYIEDN